jgi:3-oxoacyl-[acyl-carrier-protein] synthase-3
LFLDATATNHETVSLHSAVCDEAIDGKQQKAPMATVIPTVRSISQERVLNRTIRGVKIAGTGSFAAEKRVLNDDLRVLGYDADWIVQRTGILARHHVLPGQATSDLAIPAARKCLADAGVRPADVDFIIVATMTPDHYTPSSSSLVQAALGCKCPAIDVNAACSGFMYALIIGAQFVKTGCARNVLVIGADVMSMVVDPCDKKTYPLFGDGAGAALLTPDEDGPEGEGCGILAYLLASEGELSHLLVVPAGGSRCPASRAAVDGHQQFLKMEGQAVFKWAVRLIPEVTRTLLGHSGLSLSDIDLFIFHQANRRILDSAVEYLGVPPDRVFMNLDEYGNTSAASIPLSLDEAIRAGRAPKGSRVLLCGFGAGLSWGACIFQF